MERLVTTSEASQILGLSLQGVHYRIRNNQLKSLKQSGKTYVYLPDEKIQESKQTSQDSLENDHKLNYKNKALSNFDKIIEVKDEQINLLKKAIKWQKRQFTDEINRLEKSQERIISVFDSEIKLLQSAFNEMRSVYKPQITDNQYSTQNKEDNFMTISDFTALMKSYKKTDNEIKVIILKSVKSGDKRFFYDKARKKVLILKDKFSDLK